VGLVLAVALAVTLVLVLLSVEAHGLVVGAHELAAHGLARWTSSRTSSPPCSTPATAAADRVLDAPAAAVLTRGGRPPPCSTFDVRARRRGIHAFMRRHPMRGPTERCYCHGS
jgi:hypothetical protein